MAEWRKIPGWDRYEVSDLGGVRRALNRNPLKTHINDRGYPTAHLRMQGREKQMPVHVAVLLAFVGPKPTAQHQAAHGDGDRSRSVLSNLRWATPKENCSDRWLHGTQPSGESHHTAKFSTAEVSQIFILFEVGKSCREISEKVGCSVGHVYKILAGQRRLDAKS